jgi:hypothetical protein
MNDVIAQRRFLMVDRAMPGSSLMYGKQPLDEACVIWGLSKLVRANWQWGSLGATVLRRDRDHTANVGVPLGNTRLFKFPSLNYGG